ncbi:RHS repeat-associated core domain-containing protein [Moritella sp. 28]|uniref:RHS repeat-associated core domain-containing protein n=1 Tax=Moritella sp. 28 TaxID=2746232 RepID=UPI001BABF3E5|nr:RHS repeat-associated core domain-containing protein [Moritella sp. 28]
MPNMGRWLNRDPLQEQGGINLYAYVNGDPMGYVDPDGRNPLVILIVINTGIGAVNGGIGAGVQGGNFDDIVDGAVWGGFGGLASFPLGPALGAMLGNAMGQMATMSGKNKDYSCFNYGSMFGAGLGSGIAGKLTGYSGGVFLGAQLDFGLATTMSILGGELNK